MLILSRTPLRISFFGGGTDYLPYYQHHPGAVLGTTIDHYTYITVKTLPAGLFPHRMKLTYSRTELVQAIADIQHPSIRETLRYMDWEDPLEIHIFADLPARSGLGSSSSFTVGFLHALYALQGETPSKQLLADTACYIEQQCIQENVGSQDQFHAAFGGLNRIDFSQEGITVHPIACPAKATFCDHLMLFFTGLTRHASEVVAEQVQKTATRANDPLLGFLYQSVDLAQHILEQPSPCWQTLGELFDESWQRKKLLSSQVSSSHLDEIYSKAKQAGAYGGKLCGAGQGGFFLFLVPPEKQPAVTAALTPLPQVPFRFEEEGSSLIYQKCDAPVVSCS